MGVKLRKRQNGDGSVSLRLDITNNGNRWIETLKLLQLVKVSNHADRLSNKERLAQAEKFAVNRAAELQANGYSMESDLGRKTLVVQWMQSYVDTYQKRDKRNMQGVLKKFISFLGQENQSALVFGNLTPLLIEDFMEYLEAQHKGEGARSYYSRFKKMLKQAYRKKLLKTNVLEDVERKMKGCAKKKDVLTIEEVKLLALTPIQSMEVRNAFLFCCLTGLRWCDVKELSWSAINEKDKTFKIMQSKTEKEIVNPINETAFKLIGIRQQASDKVFNLPSANGANKTLKAWVKRAGIHKTITWHNARHSFGTNLIFNNVEVLTTSKLLGHTSLKHTYRYIDTAKTLKEEATNKLNFSI